MFLVGGALKSGQVLIFTGGKWLLKSQKVTSTALQILPDFANSQKAYEHYIKHANGIIKNRKKAGVYKLKKGGADMPEFSMNQDGYIAAARSFWAPNSRNGILQGTRLSDGAIIRFEPSTGYVGVMQEGSISTFFRPTSNIEGISDAKAQVTWFLNNIDGW